MIGNENMTEAEWDCDNALATVESVVANTGATVVNNISESVFRMLQNVFLPDTSEPPLSARLVLDWM